MESDFIYYVCGALVFLGGLSLGGLLSMQAYHNARSREVPLYFLLGVISMVPSIGYLLILKRKGGMLG